VFNAEFPLLNLVVFVLLISIGVDGAFLLVKTFPTGPTSLTEAGVRRALSHTATTMFLTQCSTVTISIKYKYFIFYL
jgi:hypothetical protein